MDEMSHAHAHACWTSTYCEQELCSAQSGPIKLGVSTTVTHTHTHTSSSCSSQFRKVKKTVQSHSGAARNWWFPPHRVDQDSLNVAQTFLTAAFVRKQKKREETAPGRCLGLLTLHSAFCSTLQNKEKERLKDREREAREREARSSNGHLFTSLTVSSTTLCSSCNRSITAKEALSCPGQHTSVSCCLQCS